MPGVPDAWIVQVTWGAGMKQPSRILSEAQFLNDVRGHQMTVIRDDGVHRHVRFARPGSYCMHFDLITWPGYLCYTGDMGTYVFRRLEDMFQFFRDERAGRPGEDETLHINLGYWSEKLEAADCHGRHVVGVEEFDEERFLSTINEIRKGWIKENRDVLTKDERRELWEAVENEVLSQVDDGEYAARAAAGGFMHTAGGKRFEFVDLWDYSFGRFTYRFVWCCYALAWGIGKYDAAKKLEVVQ